MVQHSGSQITGDTGNWRCQGLPQPVAAPRHCTHDIAKLHQLNRIAVRLSPGDLKAQLAALESVWKQLMNSVVAFSQRSRPDTNKS